MSAPTMAHRLAAEFVGTFLLVFGLIALFAVAYCGILTALIAFLLKPLGWRISDEEEATGIDETEHAETAYDYA